MFESLSIGSREGLMMASTCSKSACVGAIRSRRIRCACMYSTAGMKRHSRSALGQPVRPWSANSRSLPVSSNSSNAALPSEYRIVRDSSIYWL